MVVQAPHRNRKDDIPLACSSLPEKVMDPMVNSSPQILLSNMQYRSDNRVTQCTFGNGLVDSRQYDQQGRLQNQSLGLVDSRTYSYDRNGNILQRSSTPQLSQYQYDKLDRLTSDTIDSGIANNFSYDCNPPNKPKAAKVEYSCNRYA